VIPSELVTSPTLSDEAVVRRVCAGEVELFEVLVRRHDARVYRTARSILRNEAEAEDAMQSAWLHAYQHLGEFQGAAAFSTWLVRIAANEALGRLRRRARLVAIEDGEAEEESTMTPTRRDGPEDRAAAREAVRLLERAVDELPAPYRSVFVLREVEQLSTRETAQALDLGEEAVKVRLHRAKGMLRKALGEEVDRAAPEAFQFLAPRCNRMVERVMEAVRELPPPSAGPVAAPERN
jgi:RNA polymerase sigma-70 factor (ECF subfamily)